MDPGWTPDGPRMVGWLVDWLVGWLVGWSPGGCPGEVHPGPIRGPSVLCGRWFIRYPSIAVTVAPIGIPRGGGEGRKEEGRGERRGEEGRKEEERWNNDGWEWRKYFSEQFLRICAKN